MGAYVFNFGRVGVAGSGQERSNASCPATELPTGLRRPVFAVRRLNRLGTGRLESSDGIAFESIATLPDFAPVTLRARILRPSRPAYHRMRLMRLLAITFGSLLIFGVALDAFQTIVLPRRPKGRFRITRLFYLVTWTPWRALVKRLPNPRVRDQFFSIYGPLSLLFLLFVWATLLGIAFAFLFLGIGTPFVDTLNTSHTLIANFRTDLYVSGTTLFTLGLGDVIPHTHWARFLMVAESGTGLGFVALVIGYLPVLYQAFSHREVLVALLDGRAGSPPTAAELLRRHGHDGGSTELVALLAEWERWAAELLESHISYPILCYYRSQHDNQSWLAALISILDACALVITTVEGEPVRQAQLTFAMARHALVDLGHVFHIKEQLAAAPLLTDRLPDKAFYHLCGSLGEMHMRLCGDPSALRRLTAIRGLYEPHALTLCNFLCLAPPLWSAEPKPTDIWKKVADLRKASEYELGSADHISELSVAAHLHEEDHGL
jgi:hypothetical protein